MIKPRHRRAASPAAKKGDPMTTVRVRDILLVLVLLTPACTTGEWTALHVRAAAGDAAKVKKLLDGGADVNARAENGRTALLVAAFKGHADVVKLLLEAGADTEARNKKGKTALAVAARDGQAAIVTLLLAHDADAGAALPWAVDGGHTDVVTLLLAHDPDVDMGVALRWGGDARPYRHHEAVAGARPGRGGAG